LPLTRGIFLGRLFAPVDIASLVFFRIAFGVIMVWEVAKYFVHGWIRTYYIDPSFHFTYYGFGWVQPWPGYGMYLHFLVLGVLAACVALGLWYRVSIVLFFVAFTYVYLLDQALYLNHFYLAALVSFLMIFVPAQRLFSIDVLRKPEIRSETSPAWSVWMLAAQMAIVYLYGGLAKLNGDWLRGEPMRGWLAAETDLPVVGPLFDDEWLVYFFSYGGMLFDLLIVPLLLWRRTRYAAIALALVFHLTNSLLFHIGMFPWFAVAASTLLLPPFWPRRFFGALLDLWQSPRHSSTSEHGQEEGQETQAEDAFTAQNELKAHQWIVVSLLGVYFTVQLLVPLRHFLYPGDANWTQEGSRFAWQMMLRHKEGGAVFYATDPVSGRTLEINPKGSLTPYQVRQLVTYPDMVLQYGHHIAETFRAKGYEQIEVRAFVVTSLNGREPQQLIDPTVDLAKQQRTLAPSPWIVPLEEPLPQPSKSPERDSDLILE
jgi:vitamin K-dependent gamma-carboxylase